MQSLFYPRIQYQQRDHHRDYTETPGYGIYAVNADERVELLGGEYEEHPYSSQHAYFIKGCALLCRYDESGIELIYHAVQTNHNYLEEGLEMIGTFCCITGREKELLEYRERAQVLAQKDIDEYSETCVLSKNDNLVHDDMPSEMLEEFLSYIRSVDGGIIRSVYLVRKVVNDNFFTSAFVLQFDGGSDEVRDDVRHKIFRYLDTYPVEWHFSLFEYSECYNIKFDKIEGSLVYSRAQD
jgi:hypothetical protein